MIADKPSQSPSESLSTPRATGKTYWRSLDELADTPAFRQWVDQQFPQSMRELLDEGMDRRRFLQLMAASLGLAGLAGCRRPELKALPYTKPPEGVVPGLPNFYATAMPRASSAFPVLVESHEGRPTKIEGNPRHPDSGGASDAQAQASVLGLYDPDRSSTVLKKGQPSSWKDFDAFAADHFTAVREQKGRGLHVMSDDVASPSLDLLREHLRTVMPEARWHVFEPVGRGSVREGAHLAFGESLGPRYQFDRAEVILALDCDFLGREEDGVRHVRGFAQARLAEGAGVRMNRLYAVESQYTVTGGMADHRLRLAASHVGDYTLVLAKELLLSDPVVPAPGSPQAALRQALASFKPSVSFDPRWVREVAADLRAHRGKGIIIAGRRQPPLVHVLVHALNSALGNLGQTVELRKGPVNPATDTLDDLAQAIRSGRVQTLVILGGNPAYNAPADLDFAALMKQVETTIRFGSHVDETSRNTTWHLPAAHYLESWGDARTGDGMIVAIQPLIEPLFGGRTLLEIVAQLGKFDTTVPYEIVRRAFRRVSGVGEAVFETAWRTFLHEGLLAGSAYPVVTPAVRWKAVADAVAAAKPGPGPLSVENLELVFDRDSKIDDGRFANNGWLQEVPDPITKLAWDNAAIISPKSARELGVESGDLVRLELAGRSLEIAALVIPGQADYSVAVALGYGRTAPGRVGQGVGFDAYRLRTSAAPEIALGLRLARVGHRYPLAVTAHHFTMEGRDLVREETLLDAHRSSESGQAAEEHADIHTPPVLTGEHQWGMAIDLNTCIGCNACMVACQSENNIPIVGKDEVVRGREMHWIRIDRYFSGDLEDPGLVHQPVACVHCESAPCEVVCPVNATVHSDDGLNLMVYNRCIGTRYCLNNCPYKVRRFNFFNYNERPLDQLWIGPLAPEGMAETLKMQKNPDVTVRIRGVMEKCTYCVQRIDRAKLGARVAAGASGPAPVPDGTIIPACAQACPAQAIVFGDLADPRSKVSLIKNQARNYNLLGELNTKPRTSYLARLRNPNPNMLAASDPRRSANMNLQAQTVTPSPPPLIEGDHDLSSLTELVCGLVEQPARPWWWIALAISGSIGVLGAFMTVYVISTGMGIWGMNQTVGWGLPIGTFVFWVGIGHAGTLISAILYLFRQKWRSSLNRAAEAMTLFAVACAAVYVMIHLGRVWTSWYIVPAPSANAIYPNFRSALSWDFAAIATYGTVSLLFWYVGLIPDLATLRDRARSRLRQRVFGLLALGWRGSARHWHNYEMAYLMLAGLATPLVVSVHTIVSFDFATSVVPGWHSTIFPPYFVTGAIFSGLAMVITLMVPLRVACGFKNIITLNHLENMCKLIIATSILISYAYGVELWAAWYGGNRFEQYTFLYRIIGPYGWCYATMVACNVLIPQLFWIRWFRTTPWVMFLIAIFINVGMWFERFVIVTTGLYRDYLPSSWKMFYPTWADYLQLLGGFGLFVTLFLLFVRFLPMIALSEVKAGLPAAETPHASRTPWSSQEGTP